MSGDPFDKFDEEDAMPDDLHAPHEKHLQLGITAEALGDEDPTYSDDHDAAWADATTVEQYKTAIDELAGR